MKPALFSLPPATARVPAQGTGANAFGSDRMRATPGRWSRQAEEAFFDMLGRTACVQNAIAASGLSGAAIYRRRKLYSEFAERWAGVLAEARAQLPDLLAAAAIASLDPAAPPRDGLGRLPAVNVDQAIRISRLGAGPKGGPRRAGPEAAAPQGAAQAEELRARLAAKLERLGRRLGSERRAEGWIDAGDGTWIPPGWTRTGPPETPA